MEINEYWRNVVHKLTEKKEAAWATHALVSNLDIIDEIIKIVGKKLFLKNCLLCYDIDFLAQPDLDQILSSFSLKELIDAYKSLDKKSIQVAGAVMWLLEEKDPKFNWVSKI